MPNSRTRVSPQQCTLLKALAMWKDAQTTNCGCFAIALYVALYGAIQQYGYPDDTRMKALYRSLDRLEARCLLRKTRPVLSRVTANSAATWLGRPEFSITSEGLQYLSQCGEVESPNPAFARLAALDRKPSLEYWDTRFQILGRGVNYVTRRR